MTININVINCYLNQLSFDAILRISLYSTFLYSAEWMLLSVIKFSIYCRPAFTEFIDQLWPVWRKRNWCFLPDKMNINVFQSDTNLRWFVLSLASMAEIQKIYKHYRRDSDNTFCVAFCSPDINNINTMIFSFC